MLTFISKKDNIEIKDGSNKILGYLSHSKSIGWIFHSLETIFCLEDINQIAHELISLRKIQK